LKGLLINIVYKFLTKYQYFVHIAMYQNEYSQF